METDVEGLRERLGRRKGTEEVVEDSDPFGLEVAIAVLDQIVDSVFESLNAIRLVADGLEGNLVEDAGRSGTAGSRGPEKLPHTTLSIRWLLRQVRESFGSHFS